MLIFPFNHIKYSVIKKIYFLFLINVLLDIVTI